MAGALYVGSGFYNNITNTQFINSGSMFGGWVKNNTPVLYNYMPTNYFNYS